MKYFTLTGYQKYKQIFNPEIRTSFHLTPNFDYNYPIMPSVDGYILIADITGYTGYLSASELDHAQEILTNLLKVLVQHTRAPLIISRLAGDAVISYGLSDHFLTGQVFIESIEETYVSFRQAIQLMLMNNTCRCNACANIRNLDLKFFVHYGVFALQKIDQHTELVGSDVNLAHRLLKNHVTEVTGLRAYALYTEAAVHKLGIEEICKVMTPHSETYEHLGEVRVWVQDIHPAWEVGQEKAPDPLPPDNVSVSDSIDIAAPVQFVWEYLIHPDYRRFIMGSDRQAVTGQQQGRIAPGSQYHCYHGNKDNVQTIIAWRPFEQVTSRDRISLPISTVTIITQLKITPFENGTRMVMSFSKAEGPLLGRIMVDRALPGMVARTHSDLVNFKEKVEADLLHKRSLLETSPLLSEDLLAEAARDSLNPV